MNIKSKKIEKLFVYELQGEITASAGSYGEDYLGSWREAGHSYLFFSSPHMDLIEEMLVKHPEYKFICETIMDYDQWEPADSHKPFDVPPLKFIPAWSASDVHDDMQILLDPGVVFGAGSHDTTRTCLEFLVSLMGKHNIRRVIDLGTGTGILALAAAKLGASVIAVDNNNLAVETTERNVALNKLQNKVQCINADAADYLEKEADLIISNLILSELIKLFRTSADYNSKWYIVSGLKGTEALTFEKHISGVPLKIMHGETRDIWHTLLLQKK